MDMEQTVRMAMREALGLKDRQAKGIMDVADEVAKREKQELMRHLAARKFGPAASALISLLKRVLSPRFALKLLRKGLVGAAVTILFKVLGGAKLVTRLIDIFKRNRPAPRSMRSRRMRTARG